MRKFYWIKEGLWQSAVMLVAAGIYTLFMAVNRSENEPLQYAIAYLAGMGVVLPVVFNFNTYKQTIPLVMGFGATRKEIVAGLQLYRITMLMPLMAAMVLLGTLYAGEHPMAAPLLLLTGFLFTTGIGGVLGCLSLKLSRGVLVLVSALLVAAAIVLVGLTVVLILAVNRANVLRWILAALGVAVYAVCVCFEIRSLKKLSIR